MKIALVTTFFHPVTGGVESHVYDLAKELIRKGNDVEVLCSDSTKIGPRLHEKKSMISGIKVRRFFSLFSLSYYHKFHPGILFYLWNNHFDVIHVHGFRKIETYMALLVAKFSKTKVVLTTHNPFPTTSRSKFLSVFIKLHDLTFGKWFTKKIDHIICLVSSEKKILTKNFNVPKDRVTTIPDAINDKFFKKGNAELFYKDMGIDRKKWKSIVVSAARINQAKGFQNLHKAVLELDKVLFVISGGDDGYLEKLKVLYADCENIIFTEHFLPAEKLINIYAGADIFVFPSHHEAFGMALVEAMAQGLPVISTNVGGPSDFLTPEVGILQNPHDQDLWTSNIKELLKDDQKRLSMAKFAKALSEKYTWPRHLKRIIKIYNSI